MATVDDRWTRDEAVDDDDVRGDVVPRCQRRPADVRSRTCPSSSSTWLTAAKRYEQSVVVRVDAPLRGPFRCGPPGVTLTGVLTRTSNLI